MLYIVEGVDGSGKTELCNKLKEYMPVVRPAHYQPYVSGGRLGVPVNTWAEDTVVLATLSQVGRHYGDIALDRSILSALVYSPDVRLNEKRTRWTWDYLKQVSKTTGVRVIWLDCKSAVASKRDKERTESTINRDRFEFARVMNEAVDIYGLDVLAIDTTYINQGEVWKRVKQWMGL